MVVNNQMVLNRVWHGWQGIIQRSIYADGIRRDIRCGDPFKVIKGCFTTSSMGVNCGSMFVGRGKGMRLLFEEAGRISR